MSDDEDYEAYEQDELQFFQQQEGDDEWNVVQKKKSDKAKEKPTTLIIDPARSTTLTVPCRFFRLGKCAAGKQCRFSHDPSPSGAGNPPSPTATVTTPAPVAPAVGSTIPCRYHLGGYCRNGSKCPFAHTSRKPAPAPAKPLPSSIPIKTPSMVVPAAAPAPAPVPTPTSSTTTSQPNGIHTNAYASAVPPTHVTPVSTNHVSAIPTMNYNAHNTQTVHVSTSYGSTQGITFNSNVQNLHNSPIHMNGSISPSHANGFSSMNGFPVSSPTPPRAPSLLSTMFEKEYSSVMNLWPQTASPPKFAGPSSLPAASPFAPMPPRSMSSSLPSAGLPNLSSSPSFMSALSTSPFTMFAPVAGDEEEEEDDDDDYGILPQQPHGLTIIDDTPDDLTFNPFDDIMFGTNTLSISNSSSTGSSSTTRLSSETVTPTASILPRVFVDSLFDNLAVPNGNSAPSGPKSYADIAKANIPKQEEPPATIIFDEPKDNNSDEENAKLCQFFLQGICRYGATCRNVHGNTCESCKKPCLLPDNPQQNEDHIAGCALRTTMLKEREHSSDVECGICFERTVDKGRRFGLLSHCEHPFCLECIREWRGGSGAPTSTLRSCPICRVTSYFIIPSEGFIIDHNRKLEIIDQYKGKLSTITCKYFNKGKGTCKFGTSCMYAHTNPDGSVYVPAPGRKMQDAEGGIFYSHTTSLFGSAPFEYQRNHQC